MSRTSPASHRTSPATSGEFRVFVVEGQTAERTVLAQIVRRDAAFVPDGEAATTADALMMLDAETARPDIIVLSWLLDGGEADRWAFVAEVRRRCPDAPILLPGIGAQAGDLEASLRAGLDNRGLGLIVSSSRTVIYAGRDAGGDWIAAVRAAALDLREAINGVRAAQV
jgi:hypothetical protein